jgi:hypothetical protein
LSDELFECDENHATDRYICAASGAGELVSPDICGFENGV